MPGEGSRFTVALPEHAGSAPAEGAPSREAPPVTVAPGQVALLAEDNDLVRVPASELLRRMGFEVLEASGPEAALAHAAGRRIDVLLSDVIMPGLNGPELYHRLRAEQPWVKGIFMSGHTDSILLEHGQLPPGTGYLQKPFSREAFFEAITRLMAAG